MLKWTESSDFVRRYKALEAAGVKAPSSWSVLPAELPRVATSRLGSFNLTVADLSPFAIQALAWDAGFVVVNRSGAFSWAQVFVKRQGDTMADIAATFDAFTTSPTQTSRECIGGPNGKYLRQEQTDYSTFYAKVTKCAVEVIADVPDGLSAMFAQDALTSSDVPTPVLRRHVGPGVGETNMAIHTSPNFGRWPWGECPPSGQPAGLIIPCDFNVKSAHLPASSPALDGWLQEIANAKPQQTTTSPATPDLTNSSAPSRSPAANPIETNPSLPARSTPTLAYVGGGLGLLALVVLLWCCRRRYRRSHPLQLEFEPYVDLQATPKVAQSPPPLSPAAGYSFHAVPLSPPARRGHDYPSAPLNSSKLLLHLDSSKRLDFDTIERVEVLASGTVTSVYFGYCNERPVAIKAFSNSREVDQTKLDAFVEEIHLMASFNHPNIVELLGYAWRHDPRSLVAVTEYLSQGNLLEFLVAHPGLEWSNKAPLALNIARALQYLHVMREPMVIHRDLTSKNVLVAWPHAKLSGFGVSRQTMEDSIETKTSGVGTAVYVAPEVLTGSGHYSVSADIYSFGCVLVELDTQAPLFGAASSTAVLVELLNGTRKPEMSPACPERIRELAAQCLDTDPSARPSAFDVARALEAFIAHG